MIADNNRKASIIAYYFSKFDRDAMRELGYETLTDAFEGLSKIVGKDNHYLKLRRDEFDPLTGSHRKGFNKRDPNAVVEIFHNGLKNYSFHELTDIVKLLMTDQDEFKFDLLEIQSAKSIITDYTEEEYENIINRHDSTARISRSVGLKNIRVFDPRVQNKLKELYQYRCQICGETATVAYNVDVSEAHHIDYFTKSINNDSSNITILCPDHHRVVHKAHAIFNKEQKQFEYDNMKIDALMYNVHL